MPTRKPIPIIIDWRIRLVFAVVGASALGLGVYQLFQVHQTIDWLRFVTTKAFAATILGAVCLIFAILPWNRIMANSKEN
jgi:hypothetical protein